MKYFAKKTHRFAALAAASLVLVLSPVLLGDAGAVPLKSTYLRETRMAAAATSSLRLVFQAQTTAAGTISINMNGADSTTWTTTGSGAVNATQTVSVATCPGETSTTAVPGTLAASGSGSTISITGATTMTALTSYCLDLTSASAVTNPTAGEYHPVITVGSDTITVAVRTVTNDQINVTAVVPPTFNFVLSGNSDAFTANLASGTVGITTGVTATINTNAKTGWTVWAKNTAGGLSSVAVAKTIASTTPGTSATLSAGTEGYTTGITSITQGTGAGVATAAAAYDATASAHGSGLDTTMRQIASSTGTAANAVLNIKERAAISTLTPAANDYTDTITLIGAGKF